MLFRAIDTNELELMLNGLPSGSSSFVQFWGIFFLVEIVQKKLKQFIVNIVDPIRSLLLLCRELTELACVCVCVCACVFVYR